MFLLILLFVTLKVKVYVKSWCTIYIYWVLSVHRVFWYNHSVYNNHMHRSVLLCDILFCVRLLISVLVLLSENVIQTVGRLPPAVHKCTIFFLGHTIVSYWLMKTETIRIHTSGPLHCFMIRIEDNIASVS